MSKIIIAGLDGSKSNFGIAKVLLDVNTLEFEVIDLVLIKTEKSKNKQVRASSDNLRRAQELAVGAAANINDCITVFGEVPSGGQSYDAVLGFGIVIGVYAGLKPPFCEVSPAEAKKAAVGTRTASKQEMIEWAVARFPNAPWRMHRGKATLDNEHLADALAIVLAGLKTPAFQQTIAILRASSAKAA